MATFFPWYRELGEHVNGFLRAELGQNELARIFATYEFRFGSQYDLVVAETAKADLTGWEESEIADRQNQDLEEQDHMTRFGLSKEFVYAIGDHFGKLNDLVLSMRSSLESGKERRLMSLLEEYLTELDSYEEFCQKYLDRGLCDGVAVG